MRDWHPVSELAAWLTADEAWVERDGEAVYGHMVGRAA